MKISIIIPTRNEEKFIESCLISVLNFDKPNSYWHEILVIDGASTDNTQIIVKKIAERYPQIVLLQNDKVIQACALNIGIKQAKGDYIMRLDAHSRYPKNYLSLCIETAERSGAENVGGLFITQPGGDNYSAQVVQALTTHKFGVGNAGFRLGAKEDKADTVPFGFFKKKLFDEIGLFDERLIRCQDYELNSRIIKNGGTIWRNPLIHVFYYNQASLGRFLKKQIEKEAPFNPYMWYLYPYTFAYRHAITGVFTSGIIISLLLSILFPFFLFILGSVMVLYFSLAIFSAIQQAIRYKKVLHVFTLPISFFLYHFIHGTGIWVGIFKLLTRTSPVQKTSN